MTEETLSQKCERVLQDLYDKAQAELPARWLVLSLPPHVLASYSDADQQKILGYLDQAAERIEKVVVDHWRQLMLFGVATTCIPRGDVPMPMAD